MSLFSGVHLLEKKTTSEIFVKCGCQDLFFYLFYFLLSPFNFCISLRNEETCSVLIKLYPGVPTKDNKICICVSS